MQNIKTDHLLLKQTVVEIKLSIREIRTLAIKAMGLLTAVYLAIQLLINHWA